MEYGGRVGTACRPWGIQGRDSTVCCPYSPQGEPKVGARFIVHSYAEGAAQPRPYLRPPCGGLVSPTAIRQPLTAKAYFVSAWNLAISSAVRARSKTATPPIQPVKPTLRELWITRPIVKGPPVPSFLGS